MFPQSPPTLQIYPITSAICFTKTVLSSCYYTFLQKGNTLCTTDAYRETGLHTVHRSTSFPQGMTSFMVGLWSSNLSSVTTTTVVRVQNESSMIICLCFVGVSLKVSSTLCYPITRVGTVATNCVSFGINH